MIKHEWNDSFIDLKVKAQEVYRSDTSTTLPLAGVNWKMSNMKGRSFGLFFFCVIIFCQF